MIRAVTFDAGGTLFEPWPSVGHIYAEVAAEHGATELDPVELTRRFGAAWARLRPRCHTREEWAALVDATFEGLLPEPPSRTFFPALYDRFNEPRCWHVFDDVLPAFVALRTAGVRIALLSNWDERLRPLLARLELTPCFETVVISCEVGAVKPEPGIFESAEARLGLKPAELLHIGDSEREDVNGAMARGWNALLIDRARPAGPGRLSSLRQLAGHQFLRGTILTGPPPAAGPPGR